MVQNKPRHNPDKKQNKIGNFCQYYKEYASGHVCAIVHIVVKSLNLIIMSMIKTKEKSVSCVERGIENMKNDEISTLFNTLGQVLYNQDKILKHLGINKCDSDYGYDRSTENLASECFSVARDYESDY